MLPPSDCCGMNRASGALARSSSVNPADVWCCAGLWGPEGVNIYLVHLSIIGGTGGYANVIGGTATFTRDSGLTFTLRYAK